MNDLFPTEFLHHIERLSLRIRSAAPRVLHGTSRAPQIGASLEFRDYQPYIPGDDLRRVDWNVYQRTRHLFVRCHEHNTPVPVHLVIDCSESMLMENPSRYDTAARLAAAIGSAALNSQNPVTFTELSGAFPPYQRRVSAGGQLVEALERLSLRRGGGRSILQSLDDVMPRVGGRGVLVLISDFFDGDGIDAVTGALRRIPHRLLLLRVVQPSDPEPRLDEDSELVDCETGAAVAVGAAAEVYRKYKQAYRDFFGALRDYAGQRGARLESFDASLPTEVQLDRLFERGVLTI